MSAAPGVSAPGRESRKRLVVLGPPGRLGNKLILFAHLIAFAREHGIWAVYNPNFLEYAACFEGTKTALLCCRFPPREASGWLLALSARLGRLGLHRKITSWTKQAARRLKKHPDLSEAIVDFGPNSQLNEPMGTNRTLLAERVGRKRTVIVRGWGFRDLASLKKHGDSLRGYFAPVPAIAAAVESDYRALKATATCVVGLHARRGDYATLQGGMWFFSARQYAAVLENALSWLSPGKPRVVIVSDDIGFAREVQTLLPAFDPVARSGAMLEDLYLLAKCDYLLGPPSTFSKWASFYGKVPLCHIQDPDGRYGRDDFEVFDDLRP